MSLEHKTSLKSLGYISSNSQQYIVWVIKLYIFLLCQKSSGYYILINISKLNYWLVICIAKNFIWTTLKMIFSIFRFFCTLRFQIYKYCPIITNHTSMETIFIQLLNNLEKCILMTGFVVQGHICLNIIKAKRLIIVKATHGNVWAVFKTAHLLCMIFLI